MAPTDTPPAVRFEHTDAYDPEPALRLIDRHLNQHCPQTVVFGGMELLVHKDVFCPTLTNTSTLMLECLSKKPLLPGLRVLDVFTGSGAFAVFAAMKGCQVVAIDKYDAAAVCARANAARNNVASLVDVRVGDCLAPLTEVELFDLAIASPPLLPGQPSGGIEAALLDSGLSGTLRFIEDVGDHLLPGGSALLMLSDVFFRLGHNLHQLSSSAGLVSRAIRERKMSYEIYTVFELRRGEDGQL